MKKGFDGTVQINDRFQHLGQIVLEILKVSF